MRIPVVLTLLSLIMLSMGSAQSAREKAVLGGGCFWCVEAVFERLEGVESVVAGYAGGDELNPTDRDVNSGKTGHAQVIQVTYNPSIISFNSLLEVFWRAHDPTTPNRQGGDVGPQYRSVILYIGDSQKQAAMRSMDEAQKRFAAPIVTEIRPLKEFYEAKDFHQDFYRKNPDNQYCRLVILPKLKQLKLPE